MRECYEVNLYAPDPYEVSALIISSWAWPGAGAIETAGRERLYLSLCAWFIRDRAAREPEWAQQPQWINPNQACRADADIKRDRRTLDRRITDRVTAGHMAIPFLLAAETGAVDTLRPNMSRLSVNRQATSAKSERGIAHSENLESRVWRPSRPVLHLCAAWAVIAQEHFKENGTPLVLNGAMRRPEFLALLVHRAQLIEPLLERSQLKIAPDELIRFRLVRGGVKTNAVL
jgi:hypothetical protein